MKPPRNDPPKPDAAPPARSDIVETRHGRLRVIPNDRPVSQALALYGEWAQAEIDAILPRVLPEGVVVDAGANIGVHTVAIARARPGVVIHAIEPHPQIAEILRENTAQFEGRVVIHECALAADAGVGFIPRLDTNIVGNAGASVVSRSEVPHGMRVTMLALDKLNLENVSLIKLDIEGGEAAAIAGARQLIAKSKPVLVAEVNALRAALDVMDAMEPHVFAAFLMTTKAFNPGNINGVTKNIFGHASETALAFVPPGRNPPVASKLCSIRPIASVEDLAAAFLAAPRFGDKSPIDRDPEALRAALQIERATARTGKQKKSDGAESAALQSLLDQKDAEIATLRETLARDERAHRDAQAALTARLNTATADMDALRKDAARLSAVTADRDALRKDAERQQTEMLAKFESLTEAFNEERRSLSNAVANLEHHLGEQQAAAQRAAADLASLQLRAIATEKMASSAGAAKAKVEARLGSLSEGLRALRTSEKSLRRDLANAEREKNERLERLAELEARHTFVTQFLQPTGFVELRKGILGQATRRSGAFAEACAEIKASGFFDADWYLKSNADVAEANFDPVAHFLLFGGYEGRDPSPRFSSRGYLEAYPDVRKSGANPLLHYLRWGRREFRRLQHDGGQRGAETKLASPTFRQSAPPLEFFRGLAPRIKDDAEVQVIIPVYRGYDETLACIASVLTARNTTRHEIVVIDDCSPEPELSAALDAIAECGLITLLKNGTNRGFVATVNRGMTLGNACDVVLLNSDTLVFGDWLDRLRAHARRDKRVATVTPFTNNGTICSFPKFCADNTVSPDARIELVDELAKQLHAGHSVEIPTAVGFCMFIARSALRDVGMFDEVTFGRGYGEENDFCLRAVAKGWSNRHALDVFVFHSGEVSFADGAQNAKKQGLAALRAKHAGYQEGIEKFIAADPAGPARFALGVAVALGRVPEKLVVCFSHNLGGGIARHIRDLKDRMAVDATDIVVLQPAAAGTLIATASIGEQSDTDDLRVDLGQTLENFARAIQQLNVARIEVHSTAGWSGRIVETILKLAALSKVALKVVLHDYISICPQINLVNESGRYCGEEGVEQCRSCLSKLSRQPLMIHPDFRRGVPDIATWRGAYAKLISTADAVAAPSQDTADRFRRYFPKLDIVVEPHSEDLSHIRPVSVVKAPDEAVRIAVIGAISPVKGSQVLLDCAREAKEAKRRLTFVVVGYSNIDEELRSASVKVTGPYEEQDLGAVLAAERPHMVFLPSVWPETFCYTLSAAIAARLPICVFDLGAQAERVRERPDALVLPLALANQPSAINGRLWEFAQNLHPSRDQVAQYASSP